MCNHASICCISFNVAEATKTGICLNKVRIVIEVGRGLVFLGGGGGVGGKSCFIKQMAKVDFCST